MDHGSIRNLEQIQERDPAARGSRVGTFVMASLAGACIVFAVLALLRRPQPSTPTAADPLSQLAAKNARPAASVKTAPLSGHDVTFPELLSDDPHPTTALATLGPAALDSSQAMLPPGLPNAPPAASDRLPVVPLPAQNYLSLSPVVTQPRDSLTAMAQQASVANGPEVSEGQSGGYQLQVSSFRLQEEAQGFATALRKRGHRAHFESALVPGKGTWYRVRVGPFKTKIEALHYRHEFEQREHMVPFLVDPPDKIQPMQARRGKMPHNPD